MTQLGTIAGLPSHTIGGPRRGPVRTPLTPPGRARTVLARVVESTEVVTAPVTLRLDHLRDWLVATFSRSAETLLAPLGGWVLFVSFAGQGVRDMFGWLGYGIITVLSVIAFSALFVAAGRSVTVRRLPVTVCAYALVCVLSVVWSAYKLETVAASLIMVLTTAVGVMLAIAFPLERLLVELTRALQWTVGLSLALELYVAVVVGHRIPPLYMRSWTHVPDSYYWVNGLLFQGGPIQGFVGNRNPLAFIALLTLLCVVVLWLDHRMSAVAGATWVGLSVLTLALTRSATVTMAALACGAALVVFLVLRALPPVHRPAVIRAALVVAAVAAVVALVMHDQVTAVLGRGDDMSGRAEIWDRVLYLWHFHPLTGWGWIMYWVPWLPMFRYLVVRPDGTPTMQAHNAYIEALFQTGIIGAVVLVIAVVLVTRAAIGAALRALDGSVLVVLPALLMVALVVQSFTESRLLSEGNWVLFAAIATWLVVRGDTVEVGPGPALEPLPRSRPAPDRARSRTLVGMRRTRPESALRHGPARALRTAHPVH